ncbi:hypothetical protein QQM79_02700 [Marinobacteraceae bacterium S3BR75-40.1]
MTVTLSEPANGRVVAVWAGRDMYMGEFPVALKAVDDVGTRWEATVQLPVCTVDPDMVWALRLKVGGDAIPVPKALWYRAGSSSRG